MELEKIRQQIMDELKYDVEIWGDPLSDTMPGNYGVNDWDVEIDEDNFFVDIPNRTFSFTNTTFSGSLVMGASRGDNSFDMNFSKIADGNGNFEFVDSQTVKIDGDVTLNVNMDIFSED